MGSLAAVDTVHTAATLCDYLGDRLDATDEVVAVTVATARPDAASAGTAAETAAADEAAGNATTAVSDAERDGQEALNVVAVRLVAPDVETETRRGDPAEELLAAAAEHDVDEVVLGARTGTSSASEGLGSTAEAVLAGAATPVVVLPAIDD